MQNTCIAPAIQQVLSELIYPFRARKEEMTVIEFVWVRREMRFTYLKQKKNPKKAKMRVKYKQFILALGSKCLMCPGGGGGGSGSGVCVCVFVCVSFENAAFNCFQK